MMYDELIKRLRRCASYDPRFVIQDCEDAADAIEELLAEREENYADSWKMAFEVERDTHRWIPVTERLPEAREVVLVYGKKGGIYTAEHNRNALRPGSFWKLNSKNHHCEPTHWMPLPEPPKDGEA